MNLFDNFSGDFAQLSTAIFINDIARDLAQAERDRDDRAIAQLDDVVNSLIEGVNTMRLEFDSALEINSRIEFINSENKIGKALKQLAKTEKEFWDCVSQAEDYRRALDRYSLSKHIKNDLVPIWEVFINLQRDYLISVQAPGLFVSVNPQVNEDMDDFRPFHEKVMLKISETKESRKNSNYLDEEINLNKSIADMVEVIEDLIQNWQPFEPVNNTNWINEYKLTVAKFYTALKHIKQAGQKVLAE